MRASSLHSAKVSAPFCGPRVLVGCCEVQAAASAAASSGRTEGSQVEVALQQSVITASAALEGSL